MSAPSFALETHGTQLCLLPERAVWVEATRSLLVADVHFGKATTFRHHGVPVPEDTTIDNIGRIDGLIGAWKPRAIVFLGDFLHAPEAHAAAMLATLARWRERHASIEFVIVRGNHDRRAGDPPSWLGVRCVDEPFAWLGDGALRMCHHPQRVDGALVVAGHVHPCAVLGRGFERLRLPCFHLQRDCLTVPAFGAFTGTHPIERAQGDRVFAVAPDRVVELPA